MSEREITITLKGKNLLASDFQKAREQILGLGSASDDASKRGTGMGNAFKGAFAGFSAVAIAGAALGGLKSAFDFAVGGAIDMNSTLEKSTLQFATLMGDSQKAESHVRSLFEFAKKTPFETGPIIEASKKMQTFGGDALNTMDNLTLLGDASAATGAPIEDLGFWVGRLYASLKGGQPFGESAMRLQELAVLTPQARQEMEAMQKAGKSTEEIFAVFQGRLGEFSGAMVAQAGTWEGLTSSIKDAVNIMMADALKPMFDLVKVGAQVVLQALGSSGMEMAFTSLKDAMSGALGPSGGVGFVKGLLDALLVAADYTLVGVDMMGRAWSGLKLVFYGAASATGALALGFLNLVESAANVAAKLPGIGDSFKGIATEVSLTRMAFESSQKAFHDQAESAWEGVKGNSAWTSSLSGASNMLQTLRAEVAKATVDTTASAAATKHAAGAKAEFVAQTKAEIAAETERQKLIEKGRDAVDGILLQERLRRISGEDLRKVIEAGNVEIANEVAGLGRTETAYIGVLESSTAVQQQMAGPLKAAIGSTTAELTKLHNAGRSVGDSLKGAFKDLPGVIQKAFQGGGDLGKSIGGLFGASLFSEDSSLTKTLSSGLSKVLPAGMSSALSAAIPGIGAAIGPLVGQLGDKLFGKLFKSEGKQVNDMRDAFVSAAGGIGELDAKAHGAGLTLDRLLKAKNVKDFQAAVEELNGAFGQQGADMALAQQAMDEWGISAQDAGQKFAQAEMDTTANDMLAKLRAATAAGVDLNAIVTKGGDDFGKMVHQAIRTGTTISNEFKPVLAAMIENGTLIDENGDKFTDLAQIPFAEDIGSGIKELNVTMRELADFFMTGMKDAFSSAQTAGVGFADRVRGAVDRIPREIEIDVNGRYNPPNVEGATPGYAIGTKGVHGDYFVDHGTERTVRVHGVEAILTPEQAPDFVAAYLRQQGPMAGATAAAPNVYVLVEIDQQGRAKQSPISAREYLRREMQQIMRAGGVQVPASAVGAVV